MEDNKWFRKMFSQGLFEERSRIVKLFGGKTVSPLEKRARLSHYTYLLDINQKVEVKTYG